MVKMKNVLGGLLVYLSFSGSLFAQDIEVILHDTVLSDTLGADITFYFEVVNISAGEQIVFEVRTVNDLPPEWTSSLCFGLLCFANFVDSVATTPPNPEPPLQPGDTLITSLHVYPLINPGTANVQIEVGTFQNPDDRIVLNFTANVNPTTVENDLNQPDAYYLAQNYPNPFNPITNIRYGIKEAGTVSLKIYNILGNEIATLVNEYKPSGNFEVNFEANHLSSGVYIYRIVTNDYSESHKMILEK